MRTLKEIAIDLRTLADEMDPPIVIPPPPPRIEVGDRASLLDALQNAPEGSTIYLNPAIYDGQFNISRPLKLEGAGTGVQFLTETSLPALTVTANNVTLSKIGVAGPVANDLVILGGAYNSVLDSVITGGGHTKRGIKVDGPNFTIARNSITNISRVGQDSQAIAGWSTPGPGLIEDNLLEAASENILLGGANPAVAGTIPSDIIIRRNHLTKNLEWKGQGRNVKNLLELKAGRRITIQDNLMEHVWHDAQTGYALVFTPKVEGPVVEDVLVEGNTIRDTLAGVQLSQSTFTLQRVTFRNNSFEAGNGRFVLMLGGPKDITFENNTIYQSGSSFIYQHSGTVTGFRFVGNLVRTSGQYGICTEGNCYARLWQNALPGGVIENNAFVSFPSPANLPTNNLFLTAADPDPEGYGKQ